MPPPIPTTSGGSAPPTAGSFAPATPGRTGAATSPLSGHLLATFTANSANPAGGITASGAVNVGGGDLVVVNYAARSVLGGPLAFSDNLGNVYNALAVAGSGAGRVQPFFSRVTVAGNLTDVTAAHANSTDDVALVVAIFAGTVRQPAAGPKPRSLQRCKLPLRMSANRYADERKEHAGRRVRGAGQWRGSI